MTYQLKPNLLLQAVAGETVILDPDSGEYYTLDDVGSRMITLYRDCGSLEDAVAALVEEYEADAATVRQDLEALLQEMEAQGLAELVKPTP